MNATDLDVLDLERLLEQTIFGVDVDEVRLAIADGDGHSRVNLGAVCPASEGR